MSETDSQSGETEYIGTGGTDRYRLDALERALDILREYDQTPEDGLVVYTGRVDGEVRDHVFDDVGAFLRFPLE